MTTEGEVETKDGKKILRFERRFGHPIERVWAALTKPDELIGWLAAADVDLEGGRIVLSWQNEGGPTVDFKITELAPPTVLEYDGEGHGRLRWELRPEEGGTVLTFTATGDYADDEIARTIAGWHWHLDTLARYLDDGSRVDWPNFPMDEWEVIYRRYVARLG